MKKRMKIAVASGKGGVGKSMLTSSLLMFFSKTKKVVAVDADVDAPNLHLWLGLSSEALAKEEEDEKSADAKPACRQGRAMVDRWDEIKKVSTNELPIIDLEKCIGCGKCSEICAFGALKMKEGKPVLNKFFCEGCGACEVICPVKAIKMKKIKNGEIRIKKNVHGFPLVSAQLYPGQTGSGKIVDLIKEKAEEFKYELIMIDSPAGTGCPVIAALNGTDFVVLVTEPTPSGLSDLQRVLIAVNYFKIPFGVVINKWDINSSLSQKIKNEFKDQFLGQISYDQKIFQAIAHLKPILKTNLKAKKEIETIYNKLQMIIS
jgi:MinD superfamily P-loop ATPase